VDTTPSEFVLFNAIQVGVFSAISCLEQVTFDKMMMRSLFILDQHP